MPPLRKDRNVAFGPSRAPFHEPLNGFARVSRVGTRPDPRRQSQAIVVDLIGARIRDQACEEGQRSGGDELIERVPVEAVYAEQQPAAGTCGLRRGGWS